MYILRWIALLTGAKGESATPVAGKDAAARAVAEMNRLQAGYFHWWYVDADAVLKGEIEALTGADVASLDGMLWS